MTDPPTTVVRSRDGTPIAVFSRGNGPPLILVHGATADHTTFRVVGPRFAERFTVHAIDRRGRGASGDGPAYAIEREYEDVAAVAQTLAEMTGSAVDVLGHSYGGRCALGAALLTGTIHRVVSYEGAPAPAGSSLPPDRHREAAPRTAGGRGPGRRPRALPDRGRRDVRGRPGGLPGGPDLAASARTPPGRSCASSRPRQIPMRRWSASEPSGSPSSSCSAARASRSSATRPSPSTRAWPTAG